jgi:hypothetical protein
MPVCPSCTRPLERLERQCPRCKADLDLLVGYVNHLEDGLRRAERLTRAGDLDGAVWAYLNVLEVDPDNSTARRQVSRVVTAVRVFDRLSPGQTPERWESLVNGEGRDGGAQGAARWLRAALIVLALALVFVLGYAWGSGSAGQGSGRPEQKSPPPRDNNTLGG